MRWRGSSIQIATGKFDVTEINSVGDVANLALDIGGDFLLVEAGAKIGSNIAVGLKGVAASTADDAAINATVRTGRSVIRFPDGQLYIDLPGGWVRYGGVAQATGKKVAVKASTKLPTQIHHFATNKHSFYTKQMGAIAKRYGLDLNGAWNKAALPHLGRHPNAYHEFVLKGMQDAAAGAGGNQAKFLQLFNQYVKQPVLQNPNLLRKAGW